MQFKNFHLLKFVERYRYIFTGTASFLVTLAVGVFFIYHFHLLEPNTKINLTQSQIDETASDMLTTCSSPDLNKLECYKKQFYTLTEKYGLLTGENILISLQDKDELAKSCHVLGHNIGYASYDRAPHEFNNLIQIADMNMCGSGIMHGIVEHYVVDHPDETLNAALGEKICAPFTGTKLRSCIHLFGHLFLLYAIGDIPQAIAQCDEFTTLKFNCYDGMFMEDHQKFMLVEHGIAPQPTYNEKYLKDMEQQCLSYSGEIGAACWTEMAEMYDHVRGMTPQVVFRGCSTAQISEFARACYNKGIVAMGVRGDVFKTPEAALSICSVYKDATLYRGCLDILISTNIYNSPKTTERAVGICTLVAKDYKERCFSILGERLREVLQDKKDRLPFCYKIPVEYSQTCFK